MRYPIIPFGFMPPYRQDMLYQSSLFFHSNLDMEGGFFSISLLLLPVFLVGFPLSEMVCFASRYNVWKSATFVPTVLVDRRGWRSGK